MVDEHVWRLSSGFVQRMAALRICFPRIGRSVSTREPAPMRDALMHLGMTHMSAIARTEPRKGNLKNLER